VGEGSTGRSGNRVVQRVMALRVRWDVVISALECARFFHNLQSCFAARSELNCSSML